MFSENRLWWTGFVKTSDTYIHPSKRNHGKQMVYKIDHSYDPS